MNLIAPPAFTDNCIWMLHDGTRAVVVDPGDAAPAIAARNAQRLALSAILVTRRNARAGSVKPFLRAVAPQAVQSAPPHRAACRTGAGVSTIPRHWKSNFR